MLTNKEIIKLINAMEQNAVPVPTEKFTKRNLTRWFVNNHFIRTPLGKIKKMKDYKIAQMFSKNNLSEIGKIYLTLTKPDVILLKCSKKATGSLLFFFKSFIKMKDSQKECTFELVSVLWYRKKQYILGKIPVDKNTIRKKLEIGQLVYDKPDLRLKRQIKIKWLEILSCE